MRIVAGQFKGRPLSAPKSKNTRPTSDRAREALFNMLSHAAWAPAMEGARVIDLFAGSGALGLEALSRGASFALFVETDHAARGAIRTNIEALGLFGVTQIHRRSATALGDMPAKLGDPFDIAFLDPPYNKGLVSPCLESLVRGQWLSADTIIIVETAEDETPEFTGWNMLDQRAVGAARFWFLKRG